MSDTLKEKALKEGVPIIKDEGLAFLFISLKSETAEIYWNWERQ